MIQRGRDGIQKRLLKKCAYQDCSDGLVTGMFGSRSECAQCNGLGLVDAQTGEALPEREIIQQLQLRFEEQKKHIRELQRSNSYLQQRLEGYERSR